MIKMDLGKNNCKMGALLPSPLWISLPFIPTCQFCYIGVRHLLGFLLQRRVQQVPIWLDSNNLGRQAANTIFQNSGLSWREQEKHIIQREGSTFHIFTFTPSVSSWVRVQLFPHRQFPSPTAHQRGSIPSASCGSILTSLRHHHGLEDKHSETITAI